MASFPGLCKAVGPAEEENGERDGSLQQMLKAIADERNRLNVRQEISGLGEMIRRFFVSCGPDVVCVVVRWSGTTSYLFQHHLTCAYLHPTAFNVGPGVRLPL